MAVQAISISHLDYYNSLLNDLSPSTLSVTTILLVGVQSQLSQILLPRFALNSPQLHVALKKKKKKKALYSDQMAYNGWASAHHAPAPCIKPSNSVPALGLS